MFQWLSSILNYVIHESYGEICVCLNLGLCATWWDMLSLVFVTLKLLFRGGLINSKVIFLSNMYDEDSWILESNWFHSLIAKRKELLLKKLWLTLDHNAERNYINYLLFSTSLLHNTNSLSRHEQVCLIRLYFCHHRKGNMRTWTETIKLADKKLRNVTN